ncbi:MAG: hypothetical protein MZU91_05790 [Desulfosudis oleivorans]|nr:hypothetical protein [Desulfosudis oleivorans]
MQLFINGKEDFLNFMDRHSFQNLHKAIIAGITKDELLENEELFKQILYKDLYNKHFNQPNQES